MTNIPRCCSVKLIIKPQKQKKMISVTWSFPFDIFPVLDVKIMEKNQNLIPSPVTCDCTCAHTELSLNTYSWSSYLMYAVVPISMLLHILISFQEIKSRLHRLSPILMGCYVPTSFCTLFTQSHNLSYPKLLLAICKSVSCILSSQSLKLFNPNCCFLLANVKSL